MREFDEDTLNEIVETWCAGLSDEHKEVFKLFLDTKDCQVYTSLKDDLIRLIGDSVINFTGDYLYGSPNNFIPPDSMNLNENKLVEDYKSGDLVSMVLNLPEEMLEMIYLENI
jgi:hypothetical protein